MQSHRPTPIPETMVCRLVAAIFAGSDLHAKQIESISNAVLGVMHADRAGVASIGRAMAAARGTNAKHAIKQTDGLLGNDKIDDEEAMKALVKYLAGHKEVVVASLDWTEYAAEGHHRIALNLITKHGRATPLAWKTVTDEQLTDHRNDYEDELLRLLKRVLPSHIELVIILADRGFADIELYDMLRGELGFHFIIRFRGVITVETQEGDVAPAAEWVPTNGRARLVAKAMVTRKRFEVGAVVNVKKAGMKEPWNLATSLSPENEELTRLWGRKFTGDEVVKLYSRRFTCEENYRDEKDWRFGIAAKEIKLSTPERRTRLTLVIALAVVLLTLLGAVGEALGLDRQLRANTSKRRTHSLFRQGREYLRGTLGKAAHAAQKLRAALVAAFRTQAHTHEVFGEI